MGKAEGEGQKCGRIMKWSSEPTSNPEAKMCEIAQMTYGKNLYTALCLWGLFYHLCKFIKDLMEVPGDQVGLTCTYVYSIHNNNMYIGKVYRYDWYERNHPL